MTFVISYNKKDVSTLPPRLRRKHPELHSLAVGKADIYMNNYISE